MSEATARAAVSSALRAERRKYWLWNFLLLAFVLLLVWSVRDFRWSVIGRSWPYLLEAFGRSWLLSIMAVAGGMLLAVPLAAGRLYGSAMISYPCIGIIEFVRSMPEMMLIFWMYFGLPSVTGYAVRPWSAATAALVLIAAAYLAEVIRSGLYTIPKSQWEAGTASGLNNMQTFRYVVLPQALRNMLPAFIATLIILFKTTSLVSVIGVVDFFRAIVLMNNAQFAPYPFFLVCAAGYLVSCGVLSLILRKLDPRYVVGE
ncbi:amino acid ABC transporter permease [Pseudorhodoplanes sp.]|uniref:amino acid ABC transporter permease n=1 Tax=Pseudorhodoplanes sp. TaxID=1934341 RepID=UPI003D1210C4